MRCLLRSATTSVIDAVSAYDYNRYSPYMHRPMSDHGVSPAGIGSLSVPLNSGLSITIFCCIALFCAALLIIETVEVAGSETYVGTGSNEGFFELSRWITSSLAYPENILPSAGCDSEADD